MFRFFLSLTPLFHHILYSVAQAYWLEKQLQMDCVQNWSVLFDTDLSMYKAMPRVAIQSIPSTTN